MRHSRRSVHTPPQVNPESDDPAADFYAQGDDAGDDEDIPDAGPGGMRESPSAIHEPVPAFLLCPSFSPLSPDAAEIEFQSTFAGSRRCPHVVAVVLQRSGYTFLICFLYFFLLFTYLSFFLPLPPLSLHPRLKPSSFKRTVPGWTQPELVDKPKPADLASFVAPSGNGPVFATVDYKRNPGAISAVNSARSSITSMKESVAATHLAAEDAKAKFERDAQVRRCTFGISPSCLPQIPLSRKVDGSERYGR